MPSSFSLDALVTVSNKVGGKIYLPLSMNDQLTSDCQINECISDFPLDSSFDLDFPFFGYGGSW
ncbi:hypothetical protein V6Z11_D07G199400 [Gossypium hirsutum]|uniref:Uncharacterized protein n=1 Tax=Gossypium tomentosum TaxID=34277 RepID=A0A5D2K971_GOSTO|nr:hypothetical protein ES332_D07G213600v1 [Gossypium tomentosum]